MPADTPAVALRELDFAWRPGDTPLLSIPEFSVTRGERLFLRGPSGSGKTTLLGLLGGVLVPQRGSVTVLGQTLSALSGPARDRFRADHVGYIFQMFNLLPYLSVLDNALLGLRFSRARRRRVAEPRAEALRLLAALELPEALLHRPVTELSVGQQQRVAAVRALAGAPGLVIADEPTSALDTTVRQRFLELLFRECEHAGTTLVFVSHDPTLSGLFHRVVDLADLNRAAP